MNPVWSRDGRWLAYERWVGGSSLAEVWRVRADGTGNQRVSRAGAMAYSPAWSPDGRWLACTEEWEEAVYDDFDQRTAVYLVRRNGPGTHLLQKDGRAPAWSADGRVIAFAYFRRWAPTRPAPKWSLAAVRPNGEGFRIMCKDVWPSGLRFSPTSRKLVFNDHSLDRGPLRVLAMRTGTLRTIPEQALDCCTHLFGVPQGATWTPDGRRMAYLLNRGVTDGPSSHVEAVELTTIRPDGTGRRTLATLPAGAAQGGLSCTP
jgi:Tol biopolymer transport system component